MVVDDTVPELERRDGPVVVAVRMTFAPELNAQEAFPSLALGDAEFQRNAYYNSVYQRA